MMAIDLTRRRAARALLGGVLCVLVKPNRAGAAYGLYGDDGLMTAIGEVLKERQSARIVGSEFLREYPSEKGLGALLQRIRRACASNGMSGRWSADLLSAQVKRDFEIGSVICLNGWVLSATEARLCGVVAST